MDTLRKKRRKRKSQFSQLFLERNKKKNFFTYLREMDNQNPVATLQGLQSQVAGWTGDPLRVLVLATIGSQGVGSRGVAFMSSSMARRGRAI